LFTSVIRAASRNRRNIGGMLKLHLTNQALICIGATNAISDDLISA